MKNNLIPIAEIGPVVADLISQRWPDGGGEEVLAEKVGCDETTIYGIANVERPQADFDLIDQILCSLGRFDMWFGRFRDTYYSADLRTVNGAPHGTTTGYCYHRCRCDYCRLAHRTAARKASGYNHARRKCLECGQVFTPSRTAQKNCSTRCSQRRHAREKYRRENPGSRRYESYGGRKVAA